MHGLQWWSLPWEQREGSTCSGCFKGLGLYWETGCWTGLKSWLGISGCCRNTFESVPNVLKWEMPQGSARRCDGHGEEHPAWARGSLHASRGTPQRDSASSSCPSRGFSLLHQVRSLLLKFELKRRRWGWVWCVAKMPQVATWGRKSVGQDCAGNAVSPCHSSGTSGGSHGSAACGSDTAVE